MYETTSLLAHEEYLRYNYKIKSHWDKNVQINCKFLCKLKTFSNFLLISSIDIWRVQTWHVAISSNTKNWHTFSLDGLDDLINTLCLLRRTSFLMCSKVFSSASFPLMRDFISSLVSRRFSRSFITTSRVWRT